MELIHILPSEGTLALEVISTIKMGGKLQLTKLHLPKSLVF